MRRELEPVLAEAKTLPADELPALLGELAEIAATAQARLAAPTEARPDENLDVKETARRMGVSKQYLYRNHHKLKFAKREGRKLLFSSSALDAYLKKSR